MTKSPLPRGIRNNNPGNIRETGADWLGQNGDDGAFCIFIAPEYGIRAMARIFANYRKRGISTIEQIIMTWAPPSENNTQAYIAAVAHECESMAEAMVNDALMPRFIAAVIRHENGQQPYSLEQIQSSIAAAA